MRASIKENVGVIGVFLGLMLLTVWLQFGLLVENSAEVFESADNDPDYYMQNFVTIGVNKQGKKYQISADSMVHYPIDDRALLENPHIIQYDASLNPKHIYAKTGWLYDNRSTVLLTGNVRVVQNQNDTDESTLKTNKMLIHLKEEQE